VRGFYSPIDQLAAQLPRTKGTGAEFMTELSKRPGYKPQEVQDRDLQTLMALPKMERAQFLAALKAKPAPKLEETTLNERSEDPTKYQEYTLPGGSNYREILLQMPHDPNRKADPSSGHWDQPNVLAHVRAKDRLGPNGEKILHIEEIQSDWHQQGRDKGYLSPDMPKQLQAAKLAHQRLKEQLEQAKASSEHSERGLNSNKPLYQDPEVRQRLEAAKVEHNNKIMDLMPQVMKAEAARQELEQKAKTGVPDAPFKKNWHELALKKMIHHAAEKGYDAIAITPGTEQAKRYDLSKQVGRITHMTHHDDPDSGILFAFDPSGRQIVEKHNVPHSQLPEYIGKEGAQKLLGQKPDKHGYRELSGQNLEVGGEGMKGFYDKMVPSFLNQFGKKYGAQVGTMPLEFNKWELEGQMPKLAEKQATLHHFPITPEMREDVTKNGVPLYAEGGSVPHLAIGGQGPKNWIKGSVEQVIEPLKSTVGFMTPDRVAEQQRSIDAARRILGAEAPRATLEQMEREIQQSHRVGAINQWIERNLGNYIKKQMATHDDPIRKLAEQGIVHMPPEQMGYGSTQAEGVRKVHGAPRLGQSPEAQAWEDATDVSMYPHTIGEVRNFASHVQEPWMDKVGPETKVWTALDNMHARYLGFDHLVDILKQDLAEGRIRPEQMSKVSIEHAVRRAHEYDQERKKAMAETALKATEGMPVHKEYPEGYKWIELTLPEKGEHLLTELDKKIIADRKDNPVSPEVMDKTLDQRAHAKLEEALKYEGDTMGHCVGGYTPDVALGKSRIFSLRDAKGEPHVTIEVKPKSIEEGIRKLPDAERQALAQEVKDQHFGGVMPGVSSEDKYFNLIDQHYVAKHGMPAPRIHQIKGKGNAKPKKDYIPYVQDFVKSGNWSDVGDAKNAGLRKYGDVFNVNEQRQIEKTGEQVPEHEWLTGEDIQRLHNAIVPPGKRLKYDANGNIIGNEGGYAKGGSIKPIGYTKEKVTVSPNLDAMRYELMSVKHFAKKVK